MVLLAGPAAAMEAEIAALLFTTPAVAMAATSTAVEVLAVIGALVWLVALLVLVAGDVSHAAHHVHLPHHHQNQHPRHRHHPLWARR